MNHVFTMAALMEYQESAGWYRERSLQAAERFIREVELAIDAICHDPPRYQPVRGGFRVFRLRRFPFKIIYHHTDDLVTVYAVFHERRRPDVWRDR
ncbi:MAG: type II toxin-antitoxin system RelE/ParE family toxin [bacterium]|jgi:toxin ParE1/3/4